MKAIISRNLEKVQKSMKALRRITAVCDVKIAVTDLEGQSLCTHPLNLCRIYSVKCSKIGRNRYKLKVSHCLMSRL